MNNPSKSSPESPAKEQPGEPDSITEQMIDAALAAGHGLLVDTREFWTDEDRKVVRGMLEAGMRSVGRFHAVAAPDVAAMVKRLRDYRGDPWAVTLALDAAALIEKLGQGWIPPKEK